MRVMIMTDLEGVAGVINAPDWIYPESRYYERGKILLTEEVNAAVDGFCAAGADKIVVQDGHGHGAINIEVLDSRAMLQRGWGRHPYPFGVDRGFDVMAWVGQHPKSGTIGGHICHTGNFGVLNIDINGISVGEFGECAFCALENGVVPIFGSGDLAFTKEAQALLPGIETVSVKEGVMDVSGDELDKAAYEHHNSGAIHLQPKRARALIRDGAYAALRRFSEHPETFCRDYPAAPYTIEMKSRQNGNTPPKTYIKYHAESVAGALNQPYTEVQNI